MSGLARLVALEYLIALLGGQGRQHRYLLADPPRVTDHHREGRDRSATPIRGAKTALILPRRPTQPSQ